jgi:hypothetical protein
MNIRFSISQKILDVIQSFIERYASLITIIILSGVSISAFAYYYANGLGLAYNDARSHLDIGRRVVEGLNPGAAQLGSVWLPLTHILMSVGIWNDFMWHSGLAGAMWSMLAFVGTGVLISLFLKELGVGLLGRMVGVALFVVNINILYLQSTAMTELMLLGTMTAGSYYFLLWYKRENIIYLVQSAFWIMLSTLVRYDGWFLLFFATVLIIGHIWRTKGYKTTEGMVVLFCTLAGLGIMLWLLWNALIFRDPLYFAFGPYSAHSQQLQLEGAGVLPTKWHWLPSIKVYFYALAYNTGAFTMILGFLGALTLWLNKKIPAGVRIASSLLMAPLLFNILALYLGHSVLYIQGLSGDTWFNVRYGIMMMPSFAIFIGYLIQRFQPLRFVIIGLLAFVTFFSFASYDAVTIDDARVGSSQKNVTEISSWLNQNAGNKKGFILISAASHDSIIFSSGLPMKRFIHEGTGVYYDAAIINPDRWARWIVVRSYSDDDSTWRLLKNNPGFTEYYQLVDHYPFADIYELKPENLPSLIVEPVLKQKWGF